MKRSLLTLMAIALLITSTPSFAITQTVNEKNGTNYGYITALNGKKSNVSVDYVQYYTDRREKAQAIFEDGIKSCESWGISDRKDVQAIQQRKDFSRYMLKWLSDYGKENFLELIDEGHTVDFTEYINSLPAEEYVAKECLSRNNQENGYIRNVSKKVRTLSTDKIKITYCSWDQLKDSQGNIYPDPKMKTVSSVASYEKIRKSNDMEYTPFYRFTLKNGKVTAIQEIINCGNAG